MTAQSRSFASRLSPFALEPRGFDVEELDVGTRHHEPLDLVEHVAYLRFTSAHDRDRDAGALPLILMRDLGDRHTEAAADPVDDRADRGALRLERATRRHMKIETHR